MLTVKWVTCGDHWCSLENLDLKTAKGYGIYIIWHEGNPGYVVHIGQGVIADRLSVHRNDDEILAYVRTALFASHGQLYRQQPNAMGLRGILRTSGPH